MDGVKLDKQSI